MFVGMINLNDFFRMTQSWWFFDGTIIYGEGNNFKIGGSWYEPEHFQFGGKVVVVRFFEFLRQELNEDFCEGSLLSKELFVGSNFRNSTLLDDDDVIDLRQVGDRVSYLK